MYKNVILRNVFTNQEIDVLKRCIKRHQDETFPDEPQLGRSRLNLYVEDLPMGILIKLHEIANRVSRSKLILNHIYTVTYKKEFGEPDLPPHLDPSDSTFCLDYQLESNTYWDIAVNGVLYRLKDNSALSIATNSQAHWRKRKVFNDQEFITMIFFHFHEEDKEKKFTEIEDALNVFDKWSDAFLNDNYIGDVVE